MCATMQVSPHSVICRGPTGSESDMKKDSIKRFWDSVDVRGRDECWLWKAGTNNTGYGSFRYGGKADGAHRISYLLAHGVMPNVCRHTCDNPSCVNPSHLLDGTQKDNMRDYVERGKSTDRDAAKTHCSKGHLLDTANTLHRRGVGPRRWRTCKKCQRARKTNARKALTVSNILLHSRGMIASQLKRGDSMAKYPSLHFRIDAKLKRQIERAAKKEGMSVGLLIRTVIGDWLDDKSVKP